MMVWNDCQSMGEKATKTIQTRLHVASGEWSWLHDARLASREIFNDTTRLKQRGYNRTEIQNEVDRDDFLRNNKCAVVGKALQTWDSYQSLKEWWREQDDPDGGKPTPPSTDKSGAYPLVMAHTEGYASPWTTIRTASTSASARNPTRR